MDYTVHVILHARREWVSSPFSRGSSQPMDQTQVSHIADGLFTSWVTREAHHPKGKTFLKLIKLKEISIKHDLFQ